MLFATFHAFEDHVEFTKTREGSWRAAFRGIVDVSAKSPSLRQCQDDVRQAFDAKLAELVLERRGGMTAGRRARRVTSPTIRRRNKDA